MRSVRILGKSFDASVRRLDRLARSRACGAQRAASFANSLALGLAAVLLLLYPAVSLAGAFTTFSETFRRTTSAPVAVTRATLAPGYVGFYLIELQVPAVVNSGPADLYLTAEGHESNHVRLYLEP